MKCIALILSGGTGSRMNMDIPKQYIEVGGRMIITECISRFVECDAVDDIQIVADYVWQQAITDEYGNISSAGEDKAVNTQKIDNGNNDRDNSADNSVANAHSVMYKFHGFSVPGNNRQLSILNGLRDLSQDFQDDTLVIIHDAARPLVSEDMIHRCISSCEGHDGVMPVLPMKDTVYYSEDGLGVSELLNRDRIFAGQAPEVFRLRKYLEACEALMPDMIMEIRGSTEPAIMAGMDIAMIPGEEGNFKITTRDDLNRYREIISHGM